MRVVAAYLLAVLGGNESPSEADITNICKAGGVGVESDRVKAFLKEVQGKDLEALMEEGRGKLVSMPIGGGGGAAAAPAAAAAAEAPAAAEEKPKEEAKPEEDSDDEDMGFSLFD